MAKRPPTDAAEDDSPLSISPEKVCFLIVKAREFDVKDAVSEPNVGSNPSDDRDVAVLEDHANDPVVQEITSLINALSEDEQIDLVALTWLGRDDYTAEDWAEVREEAARQHNNRTGACRCSAIPAKNSRSTGFRAASIPSRSPTWPSGHRPAPRVRQFHCRSSCQPAAPSARQRSALPRGS